MKRLFSLLCFLFLVTSVLGFAQQNSVQVNLQNGTLLRGTLIEMNPQSHIVLSIGGIQTRIEMKDVDSISDGPATSNSESVSKQTNRPEMKGEDNLPDIFLLNYGPFQLKMKLIKGGTFSMGYDGDGSRKMSSEPIHDVQLSSFYVNWTKVTADLIYYLKYGEIVDNAGYKLSIREDWEEVNQIVEMLNNKSPFPLRLITEAQWEYLSEKDKKDKPFGSLEYNFCYDYFGGYESTNKVQIDPTGPKAGREHVVRADMSGRYRYYRFKGNWHVIVNQGYRSSVIRFTIPASEVLKHLDAVILEGGKKK